MKSQTAQYPYFFDEFQLDPLRRVLLKGGQPVSLNPKAIEVLLALVERRSEVLTKDDLLSAVWPDQIVEENNLTVHVSALRKALGDQKGQHNYIITIPGRGYQFIADVKRNDVPDALVVERHSITHITVEEDDGTEEVTPARAISTSPTKTRAIRVVAGAAFAVLLACSAFFGYRYFDSKAKLRFDRFDIKRQTNSGRVLAAVVSPDGRYVTYAQSETEGQSLWLRHVPTGSQNRIIEPRLVEYWGLTFTPDNNYIYATTFERSQADPVLSKIPVLGNISERMPVVTNAGVSFSPDGRRMAYVVSSSSSGGSILWTADPDGSGKKFVAIQKDPNFFAMQGNTVAWSPDGETIACVVVENSRDGLKMSVVGYTARDGKERRLTADPWNIITGVTWASEGLMLTANTQPGLPSQVWLVSDRDGHAQRVTTDLNDYRGVSMPAGGGSMVTVQTEITSGIWIGALNNDSPVSDFKQSFSEVGEIPAIAWSGNRDLVYMSMASGSPELWLLEAESGREKQITTGARPSDFALSPDGRYVVLVSNRAGHPNLWRMDANGTGLTQLTNGEGELRPRFASDGKDIFFQKGFGDVVSNVWRVSAAGDNLRQVTAPHKIYPDVSRDGRQVVYSYMDTSMSDAGQWRLGIANVEDGKQFASFELPGSVTNRVTRWMPDGRGLIYISTVGGISNLWLQPLDGGVARPLTNFPLQQIETCDLSPDGRSLAVVRSQKASDVVLLVDAS